MSQLKVNDLIQILIPSGSIYSGHYKSRVEDMDKDTLTLALPFKDGQLIPLHVGEQVIFYLSTENGVWVYQSVIQSRRSQPLPVIIVSKPIRADKVQRRNFYRFPVFLESQFALQLPETDPKDWPWNKMWIRNISGGGVCIASKEPIKVGEKVLVDLPIGREALRLGGQVKRVTIDGEGKDAQFLLGVEFLQPSRGQQEQIIQYIFTRQREQRNQGLR
ncbi:hypothetical protein GJ688_03475 [Heliobacillus mobilis]|uniref:C-di-GMP-binding flagellar brake protein YcgR, contains PilZNR and PilZ domains n=1 Tax=Heliobacterium mobile TaxID=28064 RepID=A0A6I3SGS9_HELMO|nr:flagellar brake domain-containing protein [Heliobacterium mobile]MTV48040.1 hypothetical protein [Heliobacterium mobile]